YLRRHGADALGPRHGIDDEAVGALAGHDGGAGVAALAAGGDAVEAQVTLLLAGGVTAVAVLRQARPDVAVEVGGAGRRGRRGERTAGAGDSPLAAREAASRGPGPAHPPAGRAGGAGLPHPALRRGSTAGPRTGALRRLAWPLPRPPNRWFGR